MLNPPPVTQGTSRRSMRSTWIFADRSELRRVRRRLTRLERTGSQQLRGELLTGSPVFQNVRHGRRNPPHTMRMPDRFRRSDGSGRTAINPA
jgi:hypothetical protein